MIARMLMALIRAYQLTLSRLIRVTLGDVCRFEPSCSRYAFACLRDHGALRGGLLSVKRLCRCHPFHPGGFDPPPPPRSDARANLYSSFPSAAPSSAGTAPNDVGDAPLDVGAFSGSKPAAGIDARGGDDPRPNAHELRPSAARSAEHDAAR